MKDKIAIIGEKSYGRAVKGFGELVGTNEFMSNPDEFKLVLFTGGADVDPSVYGDTSPLNMCHSNVGRDLEEIRVFKIALSRGIPLTGICRGAQFLHTMAGGKLMHHITGHGGSPHTLGCHLNDEIIEINSFHHQMIIPFEKCNVIGWSDIQKSDTYIGDKDKEVDYTGPEVEAAIWPEINAAGVQYHPEWNDTDSDAYKWYYEMVKCLLNMKINDFVNKYIGKENNVSIKG